MKTLIVRSLTLKLTLAFLVVSLTGVALVAVLVWGITSLEFNRFLTDRGLSDFTTAVTNYYNSHGSWAGVADYLHQQGLVSTPAGQFGGFSNENPGQRQPGNNQPPSPFVLVDQNGLVLVASGPFQQGDPLQINNFQQNVAININKQVVGYVLVTGRPPRPNPIESRYLVRTNQALLIAALGAVIIAVLLGLVLARTITRPIKELTAASSALAKGRLEQQVPVRSQDELGELTRTFNTMSADLEHANQLRKQMTADIAHDLRTPLSVITGYLEGIKDGVLKPTPTRFSVMYDEALYLQRLVEDLRTLSLADAGELSMNRQPTQPAEIIERLAAAFQQQAEQDQIHLKTDVDPGLPTLNIDPERMVEALGNLVSNAMRYTPAGGEITLAARREQDCVKIEVMDTGAGIPADILPHIFDRFYRGDDSRTEGGSGLGLAIAKSIVELEGGKITAASSGPGMGSRFTLQLYC